MDCVLVEDGMNVFAIGTAKPYVINCRPKRCLDPHLPTQEQSKPKHEDKEHNRYPLREASDVVPNIVHMIRLPYSFMTNTLGKLYLTELEAEARASRECLQTYKPELADYVPHEKSMKMGPIYHMTADIPHWITHSIEEGEVNFATWKSSTFSSAEDLVQMLDRNMEHARKVLGEVSDERLQEPFHLKMGEQILSSSTLQEMVSSTINHWVHHRGQLTVYMRLNNLPVPSIYGPSADDKRF